MGKVTDPALLAQLEGGGKITDPALLKLLDGQEEQPGILTRALRRLTTPFDPEDTKRRQVAADERASGGPAAGGAVFPLTKDSGDIRTGVQAALGGIPGFHAEDESSEAKDRLERFGKEHQILKWILPLTAGLGKPAVLPGQVARDAAPASGVLIDAARKAGRRVLGGGAEPLSTKFPISDASVDAAAKAGAFKPFGTTEHAADVLSDALDQAGALKGEVIKDMEAAGIRGPDSANVAQLMRERAGYLRKNTAGTNLPDIYEKVAADIEAAGEGGRLGVQQAENIKTSLQRQAKYGNPTDTLGNIERKKIAAILRGGVEDAAGADAVSLGTPEARSAVDALVPAKDAYALLAPAAKAAEKGLSQSVKRNAFSLRDTIMAAPKGPVGAAKSLIITKALRTYGPSTVAWATRAAAELPAGEFVNGLVLRGVPQDVAEQIAR